MIENHSESILALNAFPLIYEHFPWKLRPFFVTIVIVNFVHITEWSFEAVGLKLCTLGRKYYKYYILYIKYTFTDGAAKTSDRSRQLTMLCTWDHSSDSDKTTRFSSNNKQQCWRHCERNFIVVWGVDCMELSTVQCRSQQIAIISSCSPCTLLSLSLWLFALEGVDSSNPALFY